MTPMALRIARRELRQGLTRFSVFLACLALGVACIALVGSLAASVQEGVRRDAKAIMGGDVEVSQSFAPPPGEVLAALRAAGDVSEIASMRVMAATTDGEERLLSELKAVDEAYPLYGEITLSPAMPLADALAMQNGLYGAVAEEGLLARLGLSVGYEVEVGEAVFEIRAVIAREPDRAVSVFTLGPRLMIADEALDATGLVLPGSLITREYRVRLFPPRDARAFARELETRFPDAPFRVRDYTSAGPRVQRAIDNLHLYLTFVGLAAILVGGLGMGNAVSAFLADKRRSIAIMKCVGATPGLILSAYLLQVMTLALVGTLAGIALGAGLPFALSGVLERLLPVPLATGIYASPLLKASGFGLFTALAFSLRPLLLAGSIRAAGLFRGYLEPERLTRRHRLVAALGGLALAGYAVAVTEDTKLALFFAASALAAFGVFAVTALCVRRLAARIRPRNAPRLRLAATALHRPGNATESVIFALGLGLTVLVAVNLMSGNFGERIASTIPEQAPSYFFIDIQPDQAHEFDTLAASLPGVVKVTRQPMLRARIVRLKGQPVDPETIPREFRWTVSNDRGVTYMARQPEHNPLTAGAWWPENYAGEPLVSMTQDIGQALGLSVGDTLTVNLLGQEITARIANFRRVEWASLAMNFALIYPPGVLEEAPQSHIATVYVNGDDATEARVLNVLGREFPNVSGIRVKEVLARVGDLMQGIGLAGNLVAVVAVVTGLLVLAASLRASADRRIYEAVVLKVVGATRADILTALALEYALLGLAAGLTAAVLGTALGFAVVTEVLNLEWTFLPRSVALTVFFSVTLTLFLGLLGVRRILGQKPAAYLRNE